MTRTKVDRTFDAIVVGAGVVGASSAFHLASHGLRVLIVERTGVASGATGRSSGFVRMHYDLESDCRLAFASLPYFTHWRDMVGHGDPSFVACGFLYIVAASEAEALRSNVRMQQDIGIDTSPVGPADIRALFPHVVVDDITVAAYEAQSGYADPSSVTAGFLQAARALGAVYRGRCVVRGVEASMERVTGILTSDGAFHAPVVICAAGAWTAQIGRTVGLDIPVTSWREHTIYFGVPPTLDRGFPAVIDDINVCSFRPEGAQMMLAGVEDANEVGGSPDRPMAPMPSEVLERCAERLTRRIPLMSDATYHSSASGQDGMSPDQRPILGPAGPEGLLLACGFSGTGFKIAPAVGRAIADLVVASTSLIDISPYTLSRFETGSHLRGPHPYPPLWRPRAEAEGPRSSRG